MDDPTPAASACQLCKILQVACGWRIQCSLPHIPPLGMDAE